MPLSTDKPLSTGGSTPLSTGASPDKSGLPQTFREHLTGQITQSLQRAKHDPDVQSQDPRGKDADSATPSPKADARVTSTLTAWVGMSRESDSIEAMLAAQIVVTHDLTMAAIGSAMNRTGEARCHFSNSVTEACKVARTTLQQIETLARYRTWRHRSEMEIHQQHIAQDDPSQQKRERAP